MKLAQAQLGDLHRVGYARIGFARSPDGRTYIDDQRVEYPFHITRAHYRSGDPSGFATVYLQSLSGGLFQGDEVTLELSIEPGAAAHVSTQASTVVHESAAEPAVQTTKITAGKGAYLEYLPDPMILFPNSDLRNRTHVVATEGAVVLLCDAYGPHDPKGLDRPPAHLHSELVVSDDRGRPLCIDRFDVDPMSCEVLAGAPFHGTFMAICDDGSSLVSVVQDRLHKRDDVYAGVSTLPDSRGLYMRVVASDAAGLREAISVAWSLSRSRLRSADFDERSETASAACDGGAALR